MSDQAFEVEAGVREACGMVGVEVHEGAFGDTILVHTEGMTVGRVIWSDMGLHFRVEVTSIVADGDSIGEAIDDRGGFTTYVGAALACLAMVVGAADSAPEHVEPWVRTYFEDQLPV